LQQDHRKQPRSAGAAVLAVRFRTTGPDLRPRTIAISIASPARLPTISSDARSATAIVALPWLARSAFRRPARSTASGPRLFVSVVLAVRFAYASADTLVDAIIRAGAAAVAAVVVCQGPAWICRSFRMRRWGTVLLASLGFSVCLAVTLAGGIGTIAVGGDALLSSRAKASANYADMRKELETMRDKRGRLPAHRPVGTIQSDLTAARVDRRWSSPSSCTDATATASREFCAGYARLQGELETSKAAAALDVKIRELTLKLETQPVVRSVHPQAEVLARLFGVTPEDAEAWFALLFVSIGFEKLPTISTIKRQALRRSAALRAYSLGAAVPAI
jgi:hypothetical protein